MGEGYTEYGGVIFCRADRKDLRHLKDLKGKTFMAVDKTSFGGWRMAWRELKEHGIDPFDDFTELNFGGTHDVVVYAVRNDKVDAGTVRTDALERMAAEGKINLEDFFVFHEHREGEKNFSFMYSTHLYPEWPLAKVKHTSDRLAEKVAAVLLEMSLDYPAAKAAHCAGWTIPHNYQLVHECLKYLHVGPYKGYGKITFSGVFREYWLQLACVFFIVICLIVIYTFRVVRLNRRLKESDEYTRLILNSVQTGIAIIDAKTHNIIEMNPSAVKMIGLPKEEIIGKICHEFICSAEKGRCPITDLGQDVDNSECVLVKSDGTYLPIIKTVVPVTMRGHKYLVDSFVDITDRKQVEKALCESEKRYRRITDAVTGYIYTVNIENGQPVETVHGSACEVVTGYSPEEFRNDSYLWVRMIPQEDRDILKDQVSRLLSNDDPKPIEHRLIRKDGSVLWVVSNLVANRDINGNLLSYDGLVSDITERKQAEEALRLSEEMYRLVVDNTDTGFVVIDDKGAVVEANEPYLRLAGAKHLDDIVGRSVIEWTAPECEEKNAAAVALCVKQGYIRDFETIYQHKDGTRVIILIDAIMYETPGGKRLASQCRNITERKQAEEIIRQSEEDFRNLYDSAIDAIYIQDEQGHFLDVNHGVECMYGYTREEILDQLPEMFAAPGRNDMAEIARLIQSAFEGKPQQFEFWGKRSNGEIFPKIVRMTCGMRQGQKVLFTFAMDITERKQAEEAVRESENRYQELFSSVMEGIYIVDENEIIKFCNPAFAEILEEDSTNSLIGKSLLDYSSESQREITLAKIEKRKKGEYSQYQIGITTAKGRKKTLLVSIVPRFDKNGDYIGVFGSVLDITETKRLQELESRAARLETAGTIAGQVAHDFNNLLAPIMAYPEFIHDELLHDNKAHAYLDAIEDAARRIAIINQDLLTMGRRGHYNQEVLDLNQVVLVVAQEMESRTKTVTVEKNLCKELMNIKGGGAQIHRMLTNLLVNAQDAMDDMGQITIKTENYYADDTSIVYGRVPKGEYVKLTIADNGCGISEDIIQKILDPFFSTKTTDKKRGSGLGLSVVDAVMKDHNGYLDLSSKIGQGTSFYLYFPVSRENAGEGEPEQLVGGTEKVLVVDDDDIQREVSSRLLKKLGYEVNTASTGETAVEYIRENPQEIIVLDMVMPGGIDGAETYRQVLEINPHQKAIILSGFSESDRVLEIQKLGAGAYVRKPITKAAIAAAVRTELDRQVEALSHQ